MKPRQPAAPGGLSLKSKLPEHGSLLTFAKSQTKNTHVARDTDGSTTSARTNDSMDSSDRKSSTNSDTNPVPSSTLGASKLDWDPQVVSATGGDGLRRHSSVSSVTIQLPRNPALPQGNEKRMNKNRLRNASPEPDRFQNRVAFDNLPLGEATKNNTPSFTLNVKHRGYRAGRRSRTFMVGVDENTYSDYALQWLLDELVDDGDEIVCVRVMEKDVRISSKQYQEDAQAIMKSIIERNSSNHALSFILEYAVGKLHGTFQKLIHMHQPAMLIVGTRGRSLGGIHGLVNNRNSFSKYCLQYSPVPVVVVRPTDKRIKKKEKRAADASRQTYARMLAATNGKHEADSDASSAYDLEVQISPDEEAHQVAKVLGLPAAFDPTIKPITRLQPRLRPSSRASSPQVMTKAAIEAREKADAQDDDRESLPPGDSSDSEDDGDDGDEGEGEFEVVSGQQALDKEKMEQLHKMEVGEAAALRMKVDSDEESDDGGDSKAAS